MVKECPLRGLQVEVLDAGVLASHVHRDWREMKGVVLKSELLESPIETRRVTAPGEHPREFPKRGETLLCRVSRIDDRISALEVELIRESSGEVWTSVFSQEEMVPVFGPDSPVAYSDEEWSQVQAGALYLPLSRAEEEVLGKGVQP